MSLLTRRHDPDEHDSRDAHNVVDDDGDGVLGEVVDGVNSDGVEDVEDVEDEDDEGWWIFNCSRRQVAELLVVTVVIAVVGYGVGTGLYQLFGREGPEDRVYPWETSPAAIAASRQARASAQATPTPTPTATGSLSAQEQALRETALSTPKPERPAGMDENTPEGAIATGEYFLSLYPYMHATGDLSDWQAMSTPDCGFCNSVITKVTKLHDAGGWVDPWPQEAVATHYGVADEDPNVWVVTFHLSHETGVRHDGSGGTSTVKAEDITFLLQLRWTGHTWTVEEGESR